MTTKRAHPETPAHRRRRLTAERIRQALDDAGYLRDDAYRPHVVIEIQRQLGTRTRRGRGRP